jgi:hypothetical protein
MLKERGKKPYEGFIGFNARFFYSGLTVSAQKQREE